MKDLDQILNHLKVQLELNQIQIGALSTPVTISFYEKWLTQNYHADMAYLKLHLDTKKRPQNLNENLISVITLAQPYFPLVQPLEKSVPARVALYAQNQDYHF